MATYDSRALRRPARTDRCAPRWRSRNRRGKNPARKRVVRRHLSHHVPDERRGIAACETYASDRAARDAGCSSGAGRGRVLNNDGAFRKELTRSHPKYELQTNDRSNHQLTKVNNMTKIAIIIGSTRPGRN